MDQILGFGQLEHLLQRYGAMGLLILVIAWAALQGVLAQARLKEQDGRHREQLDRVIGELRGLEDRHRGEILEVIRQHQAEFTRVLAEHRDYMHQIGRAHV